MRRKFKDIRAQLPQPERDAAARGLRRNLKRFLRDYPEAQQCLYQARADEAPCDLQPAEDYFFPVMQGEELEFRRPRGAKSFRTGAFSIREPDPASSTPLESSKPTVVCCPAVAVDREGRRIGLGKGFYDRYFTKHLHALRVGVIFHVQFSSAPLPADSWDQGLDWIVTEKMILRTSTRSPQSWK